MIRIESILSDVQEQVNELVLCLHTDNVKALSGSLIDFSVIEIFRDGHHENVSQFVVEILLCETFWQAIWSLLFHVDFLSS